MKDSEIAILGAGVGGLTTAIALSQNGFRNISIFEQRDTSKTIGAGMVLWANASSILHKLNLLKEVEKAGGRLYKMQRWSKNNEFFGAITIAEIDKEIGSESFSISRIDLQKLLLKRATELNINMFYSHKVLKLSDKDDSTVITFDNDKKVTAAIVIGADGRKNSIARKYVNGTNKPIYQDFVNWIGIVECNIPVFIENNVLDFWGCGERFGIVPINKYKAYWAGGKKLPLNSPLKGKDNKTQILKLFASWSPKIKEIITLTKETDIKYIEVFDHDPILKWYKNNVCLIGDAAHAALPTSGQGACQAIEDAWHFSNCLKKAKTKEEAFDEFQQIRFQKTTAIMMTGRGFAKLLFNEDSSFCEERNLNAKNNDYTSEAKNIAKLWSQNL